MIAILVLALIACALTVDYFVQIFSERARRLSIVEVPPEAIYADRNHLWVWPEPSGVVRIGVDLVAASLLGQPDRIEWAAPGWIERGAPLAVVHGHGRRLTLPSPIAGTLVERNSLLDASPVAMASRPLAEGWLVKLHPANLVAQLANMKSGEQLRAWSRLEMDRLRELVLSHLSASTAVGATAADGGPLGCEVAGRLDKEAFREAARLVFAAEVVNQEPASPALAQTEGA